MLSLRLRSAVYTSLIPGFFGGYVPWKISGLETVTPFLPLALCYLTGSLLIIVGTLLILFSSYYLARRGIGTPFPLDPPQRMVVAGPYAYIQHPMVLGLTAILLGQTLCYQSAYLLLYSLFSFFSALLFVLYIEEPELKGRFGTDYTAYWSVIPRWIPSSEFLKRTERTL